MNLSSAIKHLASDLVALKSGPSARCEAANFRWESAVSESRADQYGIDVGGVTTHSDWQAEHKGYLSANVNVPADLPRSAETFLSVNSQAHLDERLDNAFLLRLESIDHLFAHALVQSAANNFWQRFFNSQKDLRKVALSHADEALRSEFVSQWNGQRTQARPAFTTFLNDFGGDLDVLAKSDWPHTLRDRLGLTHRNGSVAKPIAVALMCFEVDEVRNARLLASKKGAVASFARPTVLDAEMSSAFIPAPLVAGGTSFGHTLDLANTAIPTSFTPELLTFPIEYQPRHIKALGFITTPHSIQNDAYMLAARNRHIQGLQSLPTFATFGEVLV